MIDVCNFFPLLPFHFCCAFTQFLGWGSFSGEAAVILMPESFELLVILLLWGCSSLLRVFLLNCGKLYIKFHFLAIYEWN